MNQRINAIDRLHLPQAFAADVHKPFDQCWTVRADSRLLVVDDDMEKVSRFTDDENDARRALAILNPENEQIVLLSIDNQLLSNILGGIADCAVFDICKFYLVEFKTNAYGNSPEAVHGTFDTACGQLEHTLEIFGERLEKVDVQFLNAVEVSCQIVVSESFPKSKATKQEYRMAFFEKNGVPLDFQNPIHWNGNK